VPARVTAAHNRIAPLGSGAMTLYNWETGKSLPSVVKAESIRKITGGKVKPESFVILIP
jgi:hypothetical protein